MAEYEPGDMATYYFVIADFDNVKRIQGWTDNKQLAEFYMDFHRCPNYRLKKITKRIEEMNEIIDESIHCEIVIGNLTTRDTSGKRSDGIKLIQVPATRSELTFITEETATFFATNMAYSYLNGVVPYLKKKYQDALDDLFLSAILKASIHNIPNKISQQIQLDQLMMLAKSFPTHFGD